VPLPDQTEERPLKHEGGLPLWPPAVPFAGGLIAYGLNRGSKQTDARASEQPATEALIAAPGLLAGPAEVAGGVVRTVAKRAVVKTLGAIAITGVAAVGVLVAGGTAIILTTNYGLNEMIAAQDKYNNAIDTHRQDRPSAAGAPGGLPTNNVQDDRPIYVVRGGEATPLNLKNNIDTKIHPSGVPGFSVQSQAGLTVPQLSASGRFFNKRISATTVARLAAVGVRLAPTSGIGYHKTAVTSRPLSNADAARISAAFDPPIPNPAPNLARGSATDQ